jgi:hypothetical protein
MRGDGMAVVDVLEAGGSLEERSVVECARIRESQTDALRFVRCCSS